MLLVSAPRETCQRTSYAEALKSLGIGPLSEVAFSRRLRPTGRHDNADSTTPQSCLGRVVEPDGDEVEANLAL